MSQNRRIRRANRMKDSTVRKALESNTPLNSLYEFIPKNRRKDLDHFVRFFGLNLSKLHEALKVERTSKNARQF